MSHCDFCSRESDLTRLIQYQQDHLDNLRSRIALLDSEIAHMETQVAHNTNVISAARGLVGMRRRYHPHQTSTLDTSPRSRPKQRRWSTADGSPTHPSHDLAPPPALRVTPVGVIFTHFNKRFEAPRQSFTGVTASATVLLSQQLQHSNKVINENLRSLKPGTRVWLMYWFDRNSGLWRNFVRPPRAKGGWRVGVFATRSPNRPSPLGLSLAMIRSVDIVSLTLTLSGVDILDETPLLGFKIYNPQSDAHSLARSGWLDHTEGLQPLYCDPVNHTGHMPEVLFSDSASVKLDFLDARSAVDVRSLVQESLKRRVAESKTLTPDHAVLAVGSFRITYEITDAPGVFVTDVVSGMRPEICEAEANFDPEIQVHLAFQRAFLNPRRFS